MYKSFGSCEMRVLHRAPTGEVLCLRTSESQDNVLFVMADLTVFILDQLLMFYHDIVGISVTRESIHEVNTLDVHYPDHIRLIWVVAKVPLVDRVLVARGNSVYLIPLSLHEFGKQVPGIKCKMMLVDTMLRFWLLDELRCTIVSLCYELHLLDYDSYCTKIESRSTFGTIIY